MPYVDDIIRTELERFSTNVARRMCFAGLTDDKQRFAFVKRVLPSDTPFRHCLLLGHTGKSHALAAARLQVASQHAENGHFEQAARSYNEAVLIAPWKEGDGGSMLCSALTERVTLFVRKGDLDEAGKQLGFVHQLGFRYGEAVHQLKMTLQAVMTSRLSMIGVQVARVFDQKKFLGEDETFVRDGVRFFQGSKPPVVTTKLSPGDLVLREAPTEAALFPEFWLTHCSNCFVAVEALIPCPNCTQVVFCSINCLDAAQGHKTECRLMGVFKISDVSRVQDELNSFDAAFMLMVFRELMNPTKTDAVDDVDAPAGVMCLEGLYASFKRSMLAVLIVSAVKIARENSQRPVSEADEEIFGVKAMKLLEKMAKEACPIMEHHKGDSWTVLNAGQVGSNGTVIGCGIYRHLSKIPTSCDPNLSCVFVGKTVMAKLVRSLQPDGEGEVLSRVSLAGHFAFVMRDIRRSFMKRLGVTDCSCAACVDDYPTLPFWPTGPVTLTCVSVTCKQIIGVASMGNPWKDGVFLIPRMVAKKCCPHCGTDVTPVFQRIDACASRLIDTKLRRGVTKGGKLETLIDFLDAVNGAIERPCTIVFAAERKLENLFANALDSVSQDPLCTANED